MKKISNIFSPSSVLSRLQENIKDCIDTSEENIYSEKDTICGLSDLYTPEKNLDTEIQQQKIDEHTKDLADILLEMGKLNKQQYQQIRQTAQSRPDAKLDKVITDSGIFADNPDVLLEANAKLLGMDFIRLVPEKIKKEIFEKLDADFIRNNQICPFAVLDDGKLLVAITDPSNVFLLEDAERRCGMAVSAVVCGCRDIEGVCDYFAEEKMDCSVDDIISDMSDLELVKEEDKDFEDLEKMAGQSPVIKFVNYLITNAIHEGASDIHIEPKTKVTKVRYRVDGVLFESMQAPLKMHSAIVSRIKIMANLDISERRLPQDGKISVLVGRRGIDLRISTLPTSHGEKVVIRVLDSNSILRGLDQLGMETEMKDAFSRQIDMPHGVMLVTGPTGSGKSTTLYSALGQMDGERLNVSTVEDPVEYELGFCNQVQVNEKIGMTFASALRSLLRQDPDIIMIGEIRDQETAKIAVQAALTGHLVLSTLHTNDAPSSITRLVNIGVDPYLIAASLNAVLAQRLVRKICPKCKEPYKLPDKLKKLFSESKIDTENIYHGAGCERCRQSGYSGRLGIYEMLTIDDIFREMINHDPSASSMRKISRENGGKTLFDDGLCKIRKGLTTIEEVLRVTEIN